MQEISDELGMKSKELVKVERTNIGTIVEIRFCEIASNDVDDILNYFRS